MHIDKKKPICWIKKKPQPNKRNLQRYGIVLWCTFYATPWYRIYIHVIFRNIQAPINDNRKRFITISVLIKQKTFGMRLPTKGLVYLVYMIYRLYFARDKYNKARGKKRWSSMLINQVSGSCRGHNEMYIYIIATVSIKVATRIIWYPLPIKLLVQDLRGIAPLSNMFRPMALPVGSALDIFFVITQRDIY